MSSPGRQQKAGSVFRTVCWDMLSPCSLVQPVWAEAMERFLSFTILKLISAVRVKVTEVLITVATLLHAVRA